MEKGTGGLIVVASVVIVVASVVIREAEAEVEVDGARASRCAFSNLDPPNEARKNLPLYAVFVWTATLVKNL